MDDQLSEEIGRCVFPLSSYPSSSDLTFLRLHLSHRRTGKTRFLLYVAAYGADLVTRRQGSFTLHCLCAPLKGDGLYVSVCGGVRANPCTSVLVGESETMPLYASCVYV